MINTSSKESLRPIDPYASDLGAPDSALEFAVAFHRRLSSELDTDWRQLAVREYFQIASSGLSMDLMNRFYGLMAKLERLVYEPARRKETLQGLAETIQRLEVPHYYAHYLTLKLSSQHTEICTHLEPPPDLDGLCALADPQRLVALDKQVAAIKRIPFLVVDDIASERFVRKAMLLACRIGKIGELVYTAEKWRSTEILRRQIISSFVQRAA